MNKDVVGNDVWKFEGCNLTPEMRMELLDKCAGLYADWPGPDAYDESDCDEKAEPASVETVADFFQQPNGERECEFGHWHDQTYGDELFVWLEQMLKDAWTEAFDDPEQCPIDPFEIVDLADMRVFSWLESLSLEDLTTWHQERKTKTQAATE